MALTSDQVGIHVVGIGRASAVPDVLVLDAGTEATAKNPGKAFAAAREGLVALREAALAAGVAPDDLQTGTVALHPDWREGHTDGHVASVGLSIKVRDIAGSGPVIDAVTAAAGSVARINGITLEHSQPAELQQQARAGAVADARAKAEELATLVGRSLGACTWISEGGGEPGPRPMMARAAVAEAALPIDPGAVEVTAVVTTRWTFGD